MGCSGCKKSTVKTQNFKPESQPEITIPAGAKADLRGHDNDGNSTLEPCKFRYSTLVLEQDGTYRDYVICQKSACPVFNILTCPCDCKGCLWREE